MTSTTLITPSSRCRTSKLPTLGERLGEILPLVDIPFVEGPPVILVVGPLVLLGLLLAGPFVVLFTFVLVVVVALVAAAGLVALAGAIVVAPYLLIRRLHALIRRLHARRAGHPSIRDRAPRLVPVESPRAAA